MAKCNCVSRERIFRFSVNSCKVCFRMISLNCSALSSGMFGADYIKCLRNIIKFFLLLAYTFHTAVISTLSRLLILSNRPWIQHFSRRFMNYLRHEAFLKIRGHAQCPSILHYRYPWLLSMRSTSMQFMSLHILMEVNLWDFLICKPLVSKHHVRKR